MGRSTSLTWRQYRQFFEDWSRQLISAESYWRVAGRPVCAVNNLSDFSKHYGQATFAVMLHYGARIVEQETGLRPYMLGVIGEANVHNLQLANVLPLDGITGYGLLPQWMGPPVQCYDVLIGERVAEWKQCQRRLSIPFYPVVCAGWDATPRGVFRARLQQEDGYPYTPVVTGVTPALFGAFLDHALDFNAQFGPRENIVFLHAWNEWTESSVIEPSDRFGSAFLDEIAKRSSALSSFEAIPPPWQFPDQFLP
jgi:hypothetical protein